MLKKYFVIGTAILLCSIELIAQVGVQTIPKSIVYHSQIGNFDQVASFKVVNSLAKYYWISSGQLSDVALTIEPAPLGMFCKLDKSLDQKFPINLRFRLGEYYYTDELEYGDELGRRSATETKVESGSSH